MSSYETPRTSKRIFIFATALLVLALLISGIYVARADATAILWSSAGGNAWLSGGNWTGNAVPTSAQIAQFAANPTSGATGVGINSNTNSAVRVGAIEITSARSANLVIGDSSGATSGTLTLDGVTVNSIANVIIRHNGTGLLTLQNNQGGSSGTTLGYVLGNATDNIINIDNSGGVTISSIISGAGKKLTLGGTGTGTLTLGGVNTYSGDTTINSRTLALSGSGSIANSPNIVLAGGSTFDVSTLTTPLTLASGQGLKASGTTSTGTLATASGKGLTTAASSPLQFTAFNGTTAPLTISGAGTVTLASGNVVTVTVSNGGTPLAANDYILIAKGASGSVAGTAPTSLTVNGDGIASGTTASLQITSNQLILHVVANPSITVTGGPLSFANTAVGSTSAEQTYTVAGSNLTTDITVTAPSADFQVSKTTGSGFGSSVTFTQSGGSVATSTVFVRFMPQSTGPKSGNVANASTGATTQNVAVSGTGLPSSSLLFRSKAIGNWNATATWESSSDGSTWVPAIITPTSTNGAITIRNGHVVIVTASVNADELTVKTGGILLVNNGVTLTVDDGAGTDLTIDSPSGMVGTSGTITNNGQAQVDGVLRIDQGGFPGGGTGTYSYDQTNGTLAFNNTSGSYGVNNNNFWPTTNGPQNVSVASGGITMNVARTVGLTFQTSGGISGAGNLTVNGSYTIFNGGYIASGVPNFGSASTLIYNTGTTYGRNGEWLPNVTSGGGYPANVQLSGNTTLDLANSSTTQPFQMSGTLTIDSGSKMQMAGNTPMAAPLNVLGSVTNNGTLTLSTSSGGDIKVGGNWTRAAAGTFTPNGRAAFFTGSGAQTVQVTGGGTETFNYLIVNKPGGNVTLGTSVNVFNTLTLTAGTVNTGANTLTLSASATTTRTSGYVIGNLQKNFSGAANANFTFDVGSANGYTPVAANSTTGTGSLSVKPTQTKHPNISGTNALARYWTLAGSGITTNLTFHYIAPGDITGTESNYQVMKYNGTSFSVPAGQSVNTGTHTATVTGVNTFSDWTLAEPASVFGQLQFSAPNYNDNETNATHNATVTVKRTGASTGAVSVHYATSDGTATAGSDYTATSGTLNWADGDAADKTVNISVNDDLVYEGPENFNVTLSNPTGGASLGTPASAVVTINDNDAPPQTLVVNTTDDQDNGACLAAHCSLREAINAANINADSNTITFLIPVDDPGHFYYRDDGTDSRITSGSNPASATTDDSSIGDLDPDWPHSWWSIQPASNLPTSIHPVTIDGYSQTGAEKNTDPTCQDGVLRIELNGSQIPGGAIGLDIQAGPSTVKGLAINRFVAGSGADGIGIKLSASVSNTITGNFIGTDVSGNLAADESGENHFGNQIGVLVAGGSLNFIGGPVTDSASAAARNLISANLGAGVLIKAPASANRVQGNFIGTDAHGTSTVDISGFDNSLGNGDASVKIYDSPNNVVGSGEDAAPAGKGNVISGNGSHGVEISSGSSSGPSGNFVCGNFIGTDLSGTLNLGNTGDGVRIGRDAQNNTIGVTANGFGNVITNNGGNGVTVVNEVGTGTDPTGNSIRGNSIYGNVGFGIDFGNDGVTPNDDKDPDTGPNNLQNFPVIMSASITGDTFTISGTLNSTPGESLTLDFYANAACNGTDSNHSYGEGQTYLGVALVTTDSNTGDGSFTFSATMPPNAGQVITATATGNATSEFSHCFQATVLTPALTVSKSSPSPSLVVGQDSTYTITVTNGGTADATSATVKEALPAGLDLTSATGTNWTCTPSSGNDPVGTITCTFGGATIAASGGTSTIDVVVRPTAGAANQSVSNHYSVDPTGGANPPNPTNCTDAGVPSAGCGKPTGPDTVAPPAADLSVTKSDSQDPVTEGNNLTYTITVHNNGPGSASNVSVSDPLLTGTTFVSASGGCNESNGTVTCGLGSLANGADATATITVNVSSSVVGTTLSNTATVSATETDTDTNNNSATALTQVNAASCTTPPSGMVAWYPGNDNADDIIGGHNGAFEGAASYGAGKVSQAFSFNGTDAGVKIPASPSLDVGAGNGLTIDLWISPANLNERSLVEWNTGQGNGITGTIGAHFNSSVVSQGGSPGNLYANLIDTNGNNHYLQSPGGLVTTNSLQHIALTYDKSSGLATIYLNGVAVAGPTNLGSFTPQTSYDLYLGNRPAGLGAGDHYAGLMDEVEIFNRALDATKIAAIYNASFAGKCHTSTIQFSSAAYTVGEGGGNATITVTRTGAHDTAASVAYATVAGGTAAGGTACTTGVDYKDTSGTLDFAAGEVSKTFDLPVCEDNIFEGDETVKLALSDAGGTGASLGSPAEALLTIQDNDNQPTISIDDVTHAEGNASTTPFTYTVSLSNPSTQTVTVDFTTADGAAAQPSDYAANSGKLTFAPGDTSQQITVQVNGDTTYEADETFFVNLTSPTDATVTTGQGVGTIRNDDKPPATLMVNTTDDLNNGACFPTHCSLREAINAANFNSDANTIRFGIPSNDPNRDPTTGVFTISPASALPTVTFPVTIDGYTQTPCSSNATPCSHANTLAAGDAAVLLIQLNGANAGTGVAGLNINGGNSTVRGLVINRFDGHGINLSSGSNTVSGNFIGTDAAGTSALANGGSGVFSDRFSNLIGDANAAARNVISGNTGDGITFAGGNSYTVQGNFIGTKADGAGALGNGGNGVSFSAGTLFNTVGGTNAGEANTIAFNGGDGVHIDATSGASHTVRGNSIYSNGTTSAHLGIDFGADGVTPNDPQDADTGPNNLQNFPVINSALVTGSTRTIMGTLNSKPSQAYTIDFYSNPSCDPSGNGEGKSYIGSVTTAATDGSGDVSFTFHPSALTLGQFVTATATDANNNTSEFSACKTVAGGNAGTVQFAQSNYSVAENVAGGKAHITVSRVGGSDGSISATFSTADGTANAGSDYTAVAGQTVTFADGDTADKTVDVSVSDDSTYEHSETVNLSLSSTTINTPGVQNAPQVPLSGTSATLTITDDDAPPSLSINDVTKNEGNSGTTAFTFTVTKTGATTFSTSVDYATSDGTATAGSDYVAVTTTTLTFAPNETSKQLTVHVNGDTTPELDETFNVLLSNPLGATVADDTGTGTITNDDESVSAGQLIISEFRLHGPGTNGTSAAPAQGSVNSKPRTSVSFAPPDAVDTSPQANDEFIELYNNTDSPLLVTTTDSSKGWALAAGDGVVRFVVPAGTIIPAHGHFLGVNTLGYTLSGYPAGNDGAATTNATGDPILLGNGMSASGYTLDIHDNAGIAVFRTATPANFSTTTRLDAVGSTSESNTLYKEGAGYPALAPADTAQNLEHSFYRSLCSFQPGPGCTTPGVPKDTNDNAADFLFIDTKGTPTAAGQRLGAPGPENLSSHVQRNAQIAVGLLDRSAATTSPPNRSRDLAQDPGHNSPFGTLSIRRRVTNNTGAPVVQLRFRIVEITTFPANPGVADLRARSSGQVSVSNVGDSETCGGPVPCTVTVQGTTLEEPPTQLSSTGGTNNGGGYNSSLSVGTVTLSQPLAPGGSVNVQFLLGIKQTGSFRVLLNVEAVAAKK